MKNFETWASYQGCEEVAYDDIPVDIRSAVHEVFNVKARLPKKWLDKVIVSQESRRYLQLIPIEQRSGEHASLKSLLPKEFRAFLQEAHDALPELFSPSIPDDTCRELLCDMQCVFSAHKRLQKMRQSSKKWSEADYAANVYDLPTALPI